MTKVLIKGLGLIGSSLARAIRIQHPDVQILGDDLNSASLDYAMQNQVIDQVVAKWDQVAEMDVIILAGPVSQIIKDIQDLSHQSTSP